MVTLTVKLAEDIKALAEARAAASGFADVADYLTGLIQGEAAGSPEGLTIHSDSQLEELLSTRLDGPSVEMDADDFRRIRENLTSRLDGASENRA